MTKQKTSTHFFSFYKKDLNYLISAVISIMVIAICGLLIPLIVGFTVDRVLLNQDVVLPQFLENIYWHIGGRQFLLNNLWVLGLILLGITVIQGIAEFISEFHIAKVAENGAENMRRKLFSHLQKLPYAWHAKAETGDLVQRCTSDVEVIRRFFQNQLLQIIRCITTIIISIFVMVNLDSTLSIVSIAITPIMFISTIIYFKKRRGQFELWDETEGKLSARLQESLTGMRVIKAFGRKKFELDQLEETHRELYDYGIKQYDIMGNFWFLSDLFSNAVLALVVIIGTYRVVSHGLHLGIMLVFVSYADRLLINLRILARVIADIGKAQISFGRLKEILDAEPEPDDEGLLKPELNGNIKFNNVSFQYPDGSEPVLQNINFEIKAGQTIGILGPTGSGKSSLLLLLQKLYLPSSGTLLFDDIPVEQINRYNLRRQVGLILQESYIYSRSIGDNIRLPKPQTSIENVRRYAKIARLDNEIEQFSQGYDTVVGERGVTLSGGQKQRLAIARTLIRDCQILIFDDSLSAVDTETDREIRKSLKKRPQGTTTIIVSHRISSIYDADQIFVLEDAQITQSGTHQELVNQTGLYQRVYQIQHDWLNE
ncbi:MAG TPA: ABC transporter ATP-binding protein [Clostridiaceae bacterium]|nr:ABC transporter ATP-binding protein [Clostridiaceae bacterium]